MKSFEIDSQPASPPAFGVRTASAADAGRIAAILTECFHPEDTWNRYLQPWIQASLKTDLSHRLQSAPAFYQCLVATVEDHPVATVEVAVRGLPQQWWLPVFHERERLAYVSNLAVSRAFRRRGAARTLLAAAEALVQSWQQPRLYLHVMEANEGARRLYRSLGYQTLRVEQEWPWFGPRKLLMGKQLI